MKKVILTGGTGFLGYWLLKELTRNNIFVYAICRKESTRKNRLQDITNIKVIELDMDNIKQLSGYINEKCDVFYHLAWEGERNNINEQTKNIRQTINCVDIAQELGCSRFICTGSQAEYGIHSEIITEDTATNPVTAYGACKLSAYHLSKVKANLLDIEHTWVRVFSVYGPYEIKTH